MSSKESPTPGAVRHYYAEELFSVDDRSAHPVLEKREVCLASDVAHAEQEHSSVLLANKTLVERDAALTAQLSQANARVAELEAHADDVEKTEMRSAAELRRVTALYETSRTHHQLAQDAKESLQRDNDALRAQLREAQRNERRYFWLRDEASAVDGHVVAYEDEHDLDEAVGGTAAYKKRCDDCIDAALPASEVQGE